jgi:16S rRNA (cytosine967-C5)-methyltransferase
MAKTTVDSSRMAALKMLESVLDHGNGAAQAEPDNVHEDSRDRAFARHLVYGVLRWMTALEWLADQLLKKPLRQKDRDIHRLILIGLFQLWKGDAAAHAAIHESAECARKAGKPWAVAVINAVLRRFQREQADWIARLSQRDERLAHPAWMLAEFKADWPQDWEQIAEANNRPGGLWVRLNRHFDAQETIQKLEAGGFQVERHPLISSAVKIAPAAAVNALPGFEQGRFSVQDPAAQLATELLQLEDGQRVLDACSAPGGKTCHILESVQQVNLTALDQSPARLQRVRENVDRLGFGDSDRLKLLAANAAQPEKWWDGKPFDRILLDAPCTATGVIRRHPEIKWLRNPSQVGEAVKSQSLLLQQLWPLLNPGGILLYATCSVFKAENSKQIQQFVELHSDAERVETNATWGKNLDYGQQILPGAEDMDGFFYASLLKSL